MVGAGVLCGLDYIDIIYLYWLLLLTLGLLPGGVGFLGHTGKVWGLAISWQAGRAASSVLEQVASMLTPVTAST